MSESLVYQRMRVDMDKAFGGPKTINKTQETHTPSESDLKELSERFLVDGMIYEHFTNRLNRRWDTLMQKSPVMEKLRQSLECPQEQVDTQLTNDKNTDLVTPWNGCCFHKTWTNTIRT